MAGLGAGRSPAASAVAAGGLAVAGLFLPRLLVDARRRRRVETIRAELPDSLDLLAVSVSAGLGLEAAIAKLSESMRGPLADEPRSSSPRRASARAGSGRSGAWRPDSTRPISRRSSRSLVQGEQLGVSVAETLRTQAAEARLRRRVAAEERANKAAVKMLFPTAVLIFPALFVVILAPAILSLTNGL